jgi:hypothetical protein
MMHVSNRGLRLGGPTEVTAGEGGSGGDISVWREGEPSGVDATERPNGWKNGDLLKHHLVPSGEQ